jgi:tetratricopeptide (TPR) repeat protein
LKPKYALSIIAIVAGNAVQIQADEASPTRRAFAQLNYRSLGETMNKGVELADKGDYDKARQLYDAAIAQDPKACRSISIVVMSSCISKNSIWLFKI